MKAILLVALVVSCVSALSLENFVHGELPSNMVTAHAPASDNHLWASLVETEGETENGQLTGAAETEEDVQLPADMLAEEDDAETEEDTFSFVEAAADAAYEPVSFHASSEAEAEETAESVTHPTVEQTLSAEADHILENLVSEEEAAHEPVHAWDADTEGTMTDSEMSEVADAEVVAEAQANSASFLQASEEAEEEEEEEEESEEESEDESEEEEESEDESEEEEAEEEEESVEEAETALAEVQALDASIDSDVELALLQVSEAEAEGESDDEVADDMSESPALLEVEVEQEEEAEEEAEEEEEEEEEEAEEDSEESDM